MIGNEINFTFEKSNYIIPYHLVISFFFCKICSKTYHFSKFLLTLVVKVFFVNFIVQSNSFICGTSYMVRRVYWVKSLAPLLNPLDKEFFLLIFYFIWNCKVNIEDFFFLKLCLDKDVWQSKLNWIYLKIKLKWNKQKLSKLKINKIKTVKKTKTGVVRKGQSFPPIPPT